MHDIRSIRDNPKAFDKALERRGIHTASEEILKIDELVDQPFYLLKQRKLSKINQVN